MITNEERCPYCESPFGDDRDTDGNKFCDCAEFQLETAKKILRETYVMLCDITTEEFGRGGDKTVRLMIADFLDVPEEDR